MTVPKKRRVQLDLPQKAFSRLIQLKSETEADTYAEVIRNALTLYAMAVEEYQNGNQFLLEQKDGTVGPYPLLRI